MTRGLRMTEAEHEAYLRRVQGLRVGTVPGHAVQPLVAPPSPVRTPGQKNKTEQAYETEVLEVGKASGQILDWVFESVALRLAPRTFYHPDYFVITPARFEIHEVKGHWHDDARVKIKVAAQMFPFFHFVAVRKRSKREGGGWDHEPFPVH